MIPTEATEVYSITFRPSFRFFLWQTIGHTLPKNSLAHCLQTKNGKLLEWIVSHFDKQLRMGKDYGKLF